MSRIKSYANDKRRREVDFRGIGKEAEEINKKIGKEPCLEDISLQKRLLDPESQWNEGLALLCRNQGVKALFWLMPVYDSLNRPVRRGLRTLIAEENWLRQCAARLGTASFSPQLLAWLWKLAPDGEILPLLVDLLGNGDEAVRVAAAEALPLINDKRAIPYLAGALMQPQRYEPARVAEVLHGLGPASAVILTRLLPEMNSTSQETLLDALALFEPGYPLQPLLDCLNASEERVRAAAARVLEKNGARGAENINNVNAAAAQDAAPQPEGGLSDVV